MRRRLGNWREVEHTTSELLRVALWHYDANIVEPWLVTVDRYWTNVYGKGSRRVFGNTYKTEAKARRAMVDKERQLIVAEALDALGLEP